jgi:LysM repeat protein
MRAAFCSECCRGTVNVIAAVGVAVAIAGCSSGVSRFDYPSYTLSDNEAAADPSTTASLPVPSQSVYSHPPRSMAAYSTSTPRYYGTPPSAKPPAPPPMTQATGPRVTVQQGDTLLSLSRRYGVPVGTIQSATTIPAPGAPAPSEPVQSSAKAAPDLAGNAPQRVTSTTQLPNPDPMSGNSFRWPVKGRIVSGFGTKADGGHNDGINISVPQGTPVKAAENGVVAYAGNELKGYGNLVLVRHANNWVSAYGNNETLLVKRGDKVQRGQVIAKAGTTGSVAKPQVHFELRKGSRPVDPTKYMSSITAQAN